VPKVTSKLQVTVPKALAEQYRIKPGDDILWVAAGDAIRVVPARSGLPRKDTIARRLAIFDRASERQSARQAERRAARRQPSGKDRGWTRDELYERGRTR
jgi:bifunctional DNA-binding transcriptional regulator/antitoxin component of YhaV-PrlF toxin-antitoxin module